LSGVTAETCGEVLARIMHDDTVPNALQLRAVDLFFRLTTGYAPTQIESLTAKATTGKFFDPTVEGTQAAPTTIQARRVNDPIARWSRD
jgi:hypothetical protein